MSKSATVRLNSQVLSREFTRAAAVLGTTRSAILHRCIVNVVRQAKRDFPHAFGLLNDYEALICESIEEKNEEVRAIAKYARLEESQVRTLLRALVEQGIVIETKSKKERGRIKTVYSLGQKIPLIYTS